MTNVRKQNVMLSLRQGLLQSLRCAEMIDGDFKTLQVRCFRADHLKHALDEQREIIIFTDVSLTFTRTKPKSVYVLKMCNVNQSCLENYNTQPHVSGLYEI